LGDREGGIRKKGRKKETDLKRRENERVCLRKVEFLE
jgi:hypothetical protein